MGARKNVATRIQQSYVQSGTRPIPSPMPSSNITTQYRIIFRPCIGPGSYLYRRFYGGDRDMDSRKTNFAECSVGCCWFIQLDKHFAFFQSAREKRKAKEFGEQSAIEKPKIGSKTEEYFVCRYNSDKI